MTVLILGDRWQGLDASIHLPNFEHLAKLEIAAANGLSCLDLEILL